MIKPGQQCEVHVAGEPVTAGIVTKRVVNFDANGMQVSVTVATDKKDIKDWDEAKHPRVPAGGHGGGEFTSGGGGDDGKQTQEDGGKGKHPGKGYSAGAWVDSDGVIQTTKVEDAQRALFENREVNLDQLPKVSTLIKHLGAVAKHMMERGEKAPNFNLCNVSVAGENLFCHQNKGIPRVKMPQLDEDATKALIDHLKDKGYKVKKEREYASHLRATQEEISGVKVAMQMEKAKAKPERLMKRLVISQDDYILDGHHHWAAKLGLDSKDGNLTNDTQMKVWRVNIKILDLLKEAKKFSGPPKAVTELSGEQDLIYKTHG